MRLDKMSLTNYLIDIEQYTTMPWKITYRHFKCIKRLKQEIEKLNCDKWRQDTNLKTINGIRKLICEGNLRLVLNCVEKYRLINPKLHLDLIADGNVGLIDAIDGFDVSLGFRFSTYACNVIKSRMRNILNEQSIVLKRGSSQRVGTLIVTRNNLRQLGIKNPTDKDIADWLNINGTLSTRGQWKAKTIALLRNQETKQIHRSLDATTESGHSLASTIPHDDRAGINRVDNSFIWPSLKRHINARDFDIMQRRYIHEETQEVAGRAYNLSKERVRQIENDTIDRMRLVVKCGRINIIPLKHLITNKVLIPASIAKWSSYQDPPLEEQSHINYCKVVDQKFEGYEEHDPTMVEYQTNNLSGALFA